MKLYYGFAVAAQILLALLMGNKTRAAYASYLAQEHFSFKINGMKPRTSKALIKTEPRLQPVHD